MADVAQAVALTLAGLGVVVGLLARSWYAVLANLAAAGLALVHWPLR